MRVVLDRLAGLGTRQPDDQLVNALIACKAFFTLGHGGRSELGFRTSLNAAALSPHLGLDPAFTQPLVMETLTRAYDLRSRVVHGDEIREKHRRLSGAVFEISDFAFWAAEEIVRRAIAWSMEVKPPVEALTTDWEHYYLGV
ncbi:MAG: hypothetical protein ABI231_04950 [Candidatus Tumulicola sp.]